jgi:hypothetical protein
MSNYYFLGTLLPELQIDQPPEISFREFEQLLKDNLSAADFAKIRAIRNYYDILNLSSYWKKEELEPLGNLDEAGLEEAFVTRTMLPPYVFQYVDKYDTNESRLQHFGELLAEFFKREAQGGQPVGGSAFLDFYFNLERERRLVLLVLRAKKLGRDLLKELQYEDPDEELIAQMLAQKDAAHYEPPENFKEVASLYAKYQDEPLLLQKALIELRIRKIEEWLGLDLFSIDRILGYMIELALLEKWHQLNKQKGQEIIDSMFKEAS